MIPVLAAAVKNTKSATVWNKRTSPPALPQSPVLGILLSGTLLFLSYPPFSLGFLAWFAFVPFLMALQQAQSKGDAFFMGFSAGFVFFFIAIQWLSHVTALGWVLLAGFEALFVGFFALLVYDGRSLRQTPLRMLWISLAWTASEFFRAKLPVFGFGWDLLGYSQAGYLTVIQAANTLGVYGLGFGMMAVNAAIYKTLDLRLETRDLLSKNQKANQRFFGFSSRVYSLGSAAIIIVLIFLHGIYHQNQAGKKIGDFRISVIQGNIPQSVKWEAMARDKIIEIYTKLTELAAFDGPSLILWPEAAFPGYFNRDLDAQGIHELARKIGIPLLVGAPYLEGGNGDIAYNSAYLVEPDGQVRQRYDKQNLVPFGEYVPMQWILGGLTKFAYSLGVSDFSPGHEKTVFEILNKEVSFSVLICFEDVFPELARQFVQRGANFLVVITNDAWFGRSGAAAQHLDASIFRAVENGVPVVRAANTGISAFISNRGEVLGRVQDEKGNPLFIAGRKTLELPVEVKETLFRKGGWAFPYAACLGFVIMFAILKTTDRRLQTTDKTRKR